MSAWRPREGFIRAPERLSGTFVSGPMVLPVRLQGGTVPGGGGFVEPSGPLVQVFWHDVSPFPCFPTLEPIHLPRWSIENTCAVAATRSAGSSRAR